MLMSAPYYITKAAVLGAGTMGAQIAAHFANAGIAVVLFDLPTEGKNPNALSEKAIANLKSLQPSPIAVDSVLAAITPANYQTDLDKLKDCQLVIEAVAEKLELKRELYHKITPYLDQQAILASNTSGLSVNALVQTLPEALRPRFVGMHFFNPPRYMALVELIAAETTQATLLPAIESFLVSTLGKAVIYAKDTPNFIANRIGVFAMLVACHYAEQFNLPLEVVDKLTGPAIGRPKSATFRTADLVGLDVFSHVVATMTEQLKSDPWGHFYQVPAWIKNLIAQKALGEKTKKGLYTKTDKGLAALDIKSGQYRAADQKANKEVLGLLKEKEAGKRLAAIRNHSHPEAQFLWAVFREVFIYSAHCLADIADNARDVDLAMHYGFGWQEGPFTTWHNAGWQQVASWVKEDINAGKCLSKASLPVWVEQIASIYNEQGAYAPKTNQYRARRQLPVYQRQLFHMAVPGEVFNEGETLYENDGVRLWTQGDNIGIISFKSKMNTMGDAVLDGIRESIKVAEAKLKGLVIWQRHGEHFSAGADLMQFAEQFLEGGAESLGKSLQKFQHTVLGVRYSKVPVVAATKGYVLGGGCELMMHCHRVVAALESYIGLVEVGVGIIPGGGGSKEMALRASQSLEPEKALQKYFKNIAMAEVAKSALQAKDMGYLRDSDVVLFNPDELLYVAKQQVNALAASNFRPVLAPKIPVLGRNAAATIETFVVNMKAGGYASDYDYTIAKQLAEIMTGGNLDAGSVVDEDWYLRLERKVFLNLVQQEKTQSRVQHMLETGKPLRN
jgi:3-hydroxyacyl-CoA dehydrogenase